MEHLNYPCINPALTNKQYKYFYAGGNGESDFLEFGVKLILFQDQFTLLEVVFTSGGQLLVLLGVLPKNCVS